MLDLHCHLLPGLDDGAGDPETARAMLRLAAADGVTAIVATPHYLEGGFTPGCQQIETARLELQRLGDAEGLGLTLHSGMEVYLTPDTPRHWREGRLLPLAGSRYLLVELPGQTLPEYTAQVFFELMLQEVIPVIAHPERQAVFLAHPEKLVDFLDRGVLAQVNAGSLTGFFGREVARCAREMVHWGLVHFLGSDAHGVAGRRPVLSEAVAVVTGSAGGGAAADLLENGRRLLAGETIVSRHQAPTKKRRLFGLFG